MLVTTKLTSEFDFNACLWNVTLADDDRAIQRPISLCLFFFLSLWPNSSSSDEHYVLFFRMNIIVCKITFSAALHIIHVSTDFRKYWKGIGKFFLCLFGVYKKLHSFCILSSPKFLLSNIFFAKNFLCRNLFSAKNFLYFNFSLPKISFFPVFLCQKYSSPRIVCVKIFLPQKCFLQKSFY